MDAVALQTALGNIGWPLVIDGNLGEKTKQAVRDFQHGYTFIELKVDGIPGPKTCDAVTDCLDNQGGRCAEFFTFKEFASKGNGWIKVHPRLLNRLDDLRRRTGPIHIASGYRDPAHNKKVGGASSSQHVSGTAADINDVDQNIAIDCGFTGIGIAPNGAVVHVDVRAEGPNNTTGATLKKPTFWWY